MLALFIVAFFWRTLSGDVYQPADGGDLVSFLYPTYRFAARSLLEGVLPLWNPHLYAGAPFIGDIQAGFLYPPNLLVFLLDPDFSYRTLQNLAIAHLWWAAFGLYALARTLGLSRPAALLAGTAFGLSDPLLIHLGNYNLIAVLSWAGWILAAYHQALTSENLKWAILTAVLFAVSFFAGHGQSTYYLVLMLGLYTLAYLILDWRSRRVEPDTDRSVSVGDVAGHVFALLGRPVLIGLLAILLTAPVLLPAVEQIGWSDRAELDYQASVAFSLAPVPAVVGLLTPGFFGRGPGLHWSLWDRVELPYMGIPILLLAIAALLLPATRGRRERIPWILMAGAGFLIALGAYTPIHGWLTALLPGFELFRAPARALILWSLGLSILGGFGLDGLGRRVRDGSMPTLAVGRRSPLPTGFIRVLRWGGLSLLLFVTPLILFAQLLFQDDPTSLLRASLAGLSMIIATGTWLITWLLISLWRRGRITWALLAGSLTLLLLLELSAAGSYTDISERNPAIGFEQDGLIAYLDDGNVRPFRIDTKTGIGSFWQADGAALLGLEDVNGVANPLALRHWTRLWANLGGRDRPLYHMLNVRYVLVADGTPLPALFDLALDLPGPLTVYRNPEAFPRAWMIYDVEWVFDEESALARITAADFDPANRAILIGSAEEPVRPPGSRAADVQILNWSATELELLVSTETAGLLVLSEIWYPGWRASIDGEETGIHRANYALRSIFVPAGESTVKFWYAPRSWLWGLILAGLGLLISGGILAIGGRKERGDEI